MKDKGLLASSILRVESTVLRIHVCIESAFGEWKYQVHPRLPQPIRCNIIYGTYRVRVLRTVVHRNKVKMSDFMNLKII
jgi:hypothetical protein